MNFDFLSKNNAEFSIYKDLNRWIAMGIVQYLKIREK